MSETPDELRMRLMSEVGRIDLDETYKAELAKLEMGAEQIYQLARIADALAELQKTGIYTYPQVGDVPQDEQE